MAAVQEVQRLLSELHLECFEMAFQQRELRSIKAERLAQRRAMGISSPTTPTTPTVDAETVMRNAVMRTVI